MIGWGFAKHVSFLPRGIYGVSADKRSVHLLLTTTTVHCVPFCCRPMPSHFDDVPMGYVQDDSADEQMIADMLDGPMSPETSFSSASA